MAQKKAVTKKLQRRQFQKKILLTILRQKYAEEDGVNLFK